MSTLDILNTIGTKLPLLSSYHVTRLALFGSHALGTARQDSDIDILVDFEEGQDTLDNYMDLKFELEDIFQRSVDLVITDTIKPALKESILRSALYVKRS